MRIVLIHGFNVRDGGAGTIDKLAPALIAAGHAVDTMGADYGYLSLLKVRFMKDRTLYRIGKAIEQADCVITHSNGANYATKALRVLPFNYNNTKTVIHISPALNRKTEPPMAVSRQLVMHTPSDFWVRLSSYLPFHSWGRMGARGYSGKSSKVTNQKHPNVKGHSAWFSQERLAYTVKSILRFLEKQ